MKKNISQFKDIKKDLLFWISEYINYKLSVLFESSIENNIDDITEIKHSISDSKDIDELSKNANVAINSGLGSLKKPLYGVKKFYAYAVEYTTDIKKIDDRLLRDFRESHIGKPNTKKNDIDVTIELLNFIENSTSHNFDIIYQGARIKKPRKKVRDAMDSDEFKLFNKKITEYLYKDEITKARDIIIIRMILFCGLKPKEIVELKLGDEFVFQGQNLYLDMKNRKGIGKDEPFPLPRKHFIRQLNLYAELKKKNKDGFFFYNLDKRDNQLETSYIEQLIKDLLKFASINKRESDSEMLRTSLAIYLYNNRAKGSQIVLNTIQKIMAHKRLSETKAMIGFHDEELSTVTDIFEEIL